MSFDQRIASSPTSTNWSQPIRFDSGQAASGYNAILFLIIHYSESTLLAQKEGSYFFHHKKNGASTLEVTPRSNPEVSETRKEDRESKVCVILRCQIQVQSMLLFA